MVRNKKYFWKLFSCVFGIIFIYTLAVTVVYYVKSNELTNMEREQSQKELLKQTKEKVDHRLQVALSGLIQLKSTMAFEQYSTNTNEKLKYYYMKELLEELQDNSTAFSQFEYQIGVMKTGDNIVVTPHVTIDKNLYLNQLGLSSKEKIQVQAYLDKKNSSFGQYNIMTLSQSEDSRYITLLKKEKISDSENIIFILSFYSRNLFPKLDDRVESGFVISSNEKITIGESSFQEKGLTSILTQEKLKEINHEQGTFPIYKKSQDEEMTIRSIGSDVLKDWNYISVSSIKPETSLTVMLLQALLIDLVLLLLGFLIAFYFVQSAYKPLRKVLSDLQDGTEFEKGDEFAFIRSMTSRMKKVNESLKRTIETNQMPLKHKVLRDLLFGLLPDGKINEKLDQYDLGKLKEESTLILFEFSHYREWEESVSREGILTLKLQLLSYLKEKLELQHSCEIIEIEAEKLAVLTNETNMIQLKTWLHHFKAGLDERLQATMVIAIGEPVQSPIQLKEAYKQARMLLEYRFAIEGKSIVTKEDIDHLKHQNFYFPIAVEKDLIDFVVRGQKEKALSILHTVLKENFYAKQLNEKALRSFVFTLISTANRILQQVNQSVEDIYGDGINLYFELKKIEGKAKLEETLLSVFETLVNEIKEDTKKNDCTIADALMEYIYSNYQRDISLTDLAEHFKLSASYVSTIFKEHTGENYKEFLNRYRVEKAKEILQTQNVKIQELSGMVGYNNVNTFIRIFKKYVGLSPGQYEKERLSS
ncbi:helix-turn-helix domain-containing protein [Rossellomorea sp. NPDC077527]|uniref:helix-turn-helix domain-containing protein n=1 Tax=Rossellomorea sp. NPDC077527 TaxID=3364510 RepID=UPI0037CCB525